MKNIDIIKRIFKFRDQKGVVLLMVLAFLMFMSMGMVTLAGMIQHDAQLVKTARDLESARFVAEAGINYALALIESQGYSTIAASTITSGDSMDTGSYEVTFSEPVADRHLITSVGTVNDVDRIVTMEIRPAQEGNAATDYFSGAGNDINIKIHTNVVGAFIHGKVHANQDLSLRIQNHADFELIGDVSASNLVSIVNKGTLTHVGTVTSNAPIILFPTFIYAGYEQAARTSNADPALDDYYEGDQTFPGDLVNAHPGNGIIYINGDLTVSDDCEIYGGVVANNIDIASHKQFTLHNAMERNVMLARVGDIVVRGYLKAEEALVYAENDIYTHEHWGPIIDINGCMLAKNNVTMWNEKSIIYYTHVKMAPLDMIDVNTKSEIVSWNK